MRHGPSADHGRVIMQVHQLRDQTKVSPAVVHLARSPMPQPAMYLQTLQVLLHTIAMLNQLSQVLQ